MRGPRTHRRVEHIINGSLPSSLTKITTNDHTCIGQQLAPLTRASPTGFARTQRLRGQRSETELRVDLHHPTPSPPDPPVQLQQLGTQAERLP